MRPLLAFTIATMAAGCTFLIPFEDAPVAAEESKSTTSAKLDAAAAPAKPDASASEVDICGASVTCPAGAAVPRCTARTDLFSDYPGSRENDLAPCTGTGERACVQRCPNGCMNLEKVADKAATRAFADECDPCAGKENGTYCGRDLGFRPENADLAIKCENGKAVLASDCFKNHCHSTCTRSSPPPLRPSCCQVD